MPKLIPAFLAVPMRAHSVCLFFVLATLCILLLLPIMRMTVMKTTPKYQMKCLLNSHRIDGDAEL